MFDEKDVNLMFQLQESQKQFNDLVLGEKVRQNERFDREHQQIGERLELIESNQVNQFWKDHYKDIDKQHQKRNKRMEDYIKKQADQHNNWLKDYHKHYKKMTQPPKWWLKKQGI